MISKSPPTVLLSFDLEEFDMPLEYHHAISFENQIKASQAGSELILEILSRHHLHATFFSTYTFASQSKSLIHNLCDEHHELASHGYFHSQFEDIHLAKSKQSLEDLSGHPVVGFRMPRMKSVELSKIAEAGYEYDSSLNPVILPGRYNNFSKPRLLFKEEGLWEVPASATPSLRIPLFWLSFHHFPLWFYKALCKRAFSSGNYINIYFHPWEFIDLKDQYGLPKFLTKNTGAHMVARFEQLLFWMKKQGYNFSTISDFLKKS